jgi:hypothetical protein
MSISYKGYGTGFPFPTFDKDANGVPFEVWDGVNRGPYPDDDSYYPLSASGALVVGPGTYRPLGLTLAQLAELYWRAKRIRVEADITLTLDGGEYWGLSGYGESTRLRRKQPYAGVLPDAEKEAQLIEGDDSVMQGFVAESYDAYTAYCHIWFGVERAVEYWWYSSVWKVGELYYPHIAVSAGYCHSYISDGNQSSGDYHKPTSTTVDFMGYGDLSLWLTRAPGGYPDPVASSGSASVSILEFFHYSGRWNATTGAPL